MSSLPLLSCSSSSIPTVAAAARPASSSSSSSSLKLLIPAAAAAAAAYGGGLVGGGNRSRVVAARAQLSEIEPDLQEDPIDRWRTNGVSPEDFIYGEYDRHHTYFEGSEEKKGLWADLVEWYEDADPPTGFQGLISWLFPPAVVLGMAFNVPGEYLYIGAAVWVVVFCIIEMDKPDKPHNFEPEIYNMERTARDKLIADYNTMDIWDFNEKYGHLWDFTLNNDEIVRS